MASLLPHRRFCEELRSGFRGAFYFVGENDSFGDLLHRFAGLAALLLESQVGALFGGAQVTLQDAFGAFQELAGFEALGELGIGGFQARHFDFCADEETDGGDQLNVALFVNVRADVLQVDDADEPAAAEQGNGQERLVGIFRQLVEELEARIFGGVARDGDSGAMFSDPAGDALADAELEAIDYFLMGIFGGAEDEFFQLLYVNEARIALHQGDGEFQHACEHFVQRILAGSGDAAAEVVQ
jgi:hypothetical protein